MMPHIEKKNSVAEKFLPREKFEILLSLFGNKQARENFISLCKEYHREKIQQTILPEDAENHRLKKKIIYSPPRRAHLHNAIMDTIARLATQSRNLTSSQESVLRDLHSRENVAEAIRAYILSENGVNEEDDEDEIMKKGTSSESEVAHFHSLGREH